MTTKEVKIPAGISGVMSFTHIQPGNYPVEMSNPKHKCCVIIKEATDRYLVMELEVSENLSNVCENFMFQIQALDASGVLKKRLIYYKN